MSGFLDKWRFISDYIRISVYALTMSKADLGIRLERTPRGEQPRYYEVSLATDLFGVMVLQRTWGGVGKAGGRSHLESYPSMAAARRAASAWLRRKRRRGYRMATLDKPTT